ncbi:MAG: hypothetical protein CL878_12515 [Dehalococcoidia bacterium]|nr:hypothetical protein [Dehalococcoidia bacterium]
MALAGIRLVPTVPLAGQPAEVRLCPPPDVTVVKGVLTYTIVGHEQSHPVPLVTSGAELVGLLPPFRPGLRIRYRLHLWFKDGRAMQIEEATFSPQRNLAAAVQRRLRALAPGRWK